MKKDWEKKKDWSLTLGSKLSPLMAGSQASTCRALTLSWEPGSHTDGVGWRRRVYRSLGSWLGRDSFPGKDRRADPTRYMAVCAFHEEWNTNSRIWYYETVLVNWFYLILLWHRTSIEQRSILTPVNADFITLVTCPTQVWPLSPKLSLSFYVTDTRIYSISDTLFFR